MKKTLTQRGLTSKDETAMNLFADRVSEYNKTKGFVVVDMEAKEAPDGHWDLELIFRTRAYARDFWTDPKYAKNILEVNDNIDLNLKGVE